MKARTWASWRRACFQPSYIGPATASMATIAAPPTAAQPMAADSQRGSFEPMVRLMAAPMSGRRGIQCSQFKVAPLMSVLQRGQSIDVGVARGPEDADDDGEADGGFGRGEGDDEHGERVALHVVAHAREREQREVARVQHELDRHED